MATEEIQVGVVSTIIQNTVYALPASLTHLTATAAVETGLSSGTTGFTLQSTSTTTGLFVSAAFVRCTTGTTTICCKKF